MTAAVIAAVSGVVFWQWGVLWAALFAGQVNPFAYLVSGMWLVPAVLAMLIMRKPGAAIFTEVIAAVISALLGSTWGLDVVLSGAVQGAGAELAFALMMYRSFGLPISFLAGIGAAIGEWLHDMPVYYPATSVRPPARLRPFHDGQCRPHRRPRLVAADPCPRADRRARSVSLRAAPETHLSDRRAARLRV